MIISWVILLVFVVWQGTFGGVKLVVRKEKGLGFLSPNTLSTLSQSIEFARRRGGVPVLRRPHTKPNEIRDSVIPSEDSSPILPADIFLFPICTRPLRKVPQVNTRERQESLVWSSIVTPETEPFLVRTLRASPSITLKLDSD